MNLVVGGAADLYYYFDKSNTMKYVAYTPEFGYRELAKWKSSIKKEGKEFNKETKEFLGVLSLIFSDCGQDISLENIKLSLKSLSNSFISYNECKDQLDFKSSEINKKSKIRVGLLGGIDYNSLKTNTPVASNGKGETNFTIGTEIILIPSFLNSKLTPLLSLNYTKTGGEANYLSTPEFDKLELDFQLVELYAGLRYNLLPYSSKVNPFIGISMGKSFILNHENSILKTSSDGSSTPEPLYYGNPYKNLSNDMRLGFHYQAGINYQLTKNQGLILKLDYSSMYESLEEFQFNRFTCEAGYYFNL
ncbi:outer membrane beta-barrel protein [Gramella lutea]|uniref:Outer membrane beta-barrel protein n=1 Tax=Christiangramia lutea TaxID=1607951 RepID=A0A9X1V5A6_9FLAO|nr:outer membrane beta-barrel protein [Christiangramia lutea]MCH4824356.1 outer membrane beta-barrel protein [Christiangramia lutea]